jgi:hypothetical protein
MKKKTKVYSLARNYLFLSYCDMSRYTSSRKVTLPVCLVSSEGELPSWVRCEIVASQRGQEPLNTEAEECTLLGAVI